MPTLPHEARHVAEGFGTDAARYDRARPAYPSELIARLTAPSMLDVGCGTGIASRQFQAAGGSVLGVDPDARMAALARATGVEVEVARFESWDPAGRAFDAVVSAQSWHWIDPRTGAAKAAAALHPGGRLAVFWNVFDPAPEVASAFAAVYREIEHGLPFNPWKASPLDAYTPILAKAADGIRACRAFSEPEQWRFGWERTYTREEWLDQLPTHGGHARLSPAHMDAVIAGMAAAVDDTFVMRYETVVLTALSSTA